MSSLIYLIFLRGRTIELSWWGPELLNLMENQYSTLAKQWNKSGHKRRNNDPGWSIDVYMLSMVGLYLNGIGPSLSASMVLFHIYSYGPLLGIELDWTRALSTILITRDLARECLQTKTLMYKVILLNVKTLCLSKAYKQVSKTLPALPALLKEECQYREWHRVSWVTILVQFPSKPNSLLFVKITSDYVCLRQGIISYKIICSIYKHQRDAISSSNCTIAEDNLYSTAE